MWIPNYSLCFGRPVVETYTASLDTSSSCSVRLAQPAAPPFSYKEQSASAGLQDRDRSSGPVSLASSVMVLIKLLKTELILFGYLNLSCVRLSGLHGFSVNEARISCDRRFDTLDVKEYHIEHHCEIFFTYKVPSSLKWLDHV